MHRGKSSAFHEHIMAASSSSSDDNNNVSLGADQEEVPVSTRDTASSNVVSKRRGGVPYNRIYSPASTRHIKRMTFQCKFVCV